MVVKLNRVLSFKAGESATPKCKICEDGRVHSVRY